MASVYGGAYLTIAASWGSSMHDGIFVDRPPISSVSVGLRSSDASSDHAPTKGRMEKALSNKRRVKSAAEPLYSRGWAL